MTPATVIVFSITTGISFFGISHLETWYRRRKLSQRSRSSFHTLSQPSSGTTQRTQLALVLGRLAAPKKEKDKSRITRELIHAGFRRPDALQLYYGLRVGLGLVLSFLIIMPLLIFGHFSPDQTLFLILPFALGYGTPALVLRQKLSSRQHRIFEELPDTLDLLGICLKAGMGFDFALYRVCRELAEIAPVLSREFSLFFLEVKGGLPREEALYHLQDRNPSPELTSVVTVLLQSAKSGTDMAAALKTYTDNMRTERRQKAEEAAGKLSTKLTLPLVAFILPALILIILGPTIINFITLVKDGF